MQDSPDHQIIMQWVSFVGDVLAESSISVGPSVMSPLSPPLRIGEYVFVAGSALMPGGEGIMIFRFSYPGLEHDHVGVFPPFSECWGGDPILAKDPVMNQIMLFHRCNSMENVVIEWMDIDLNPTGATTVFGHAPVTSYHASSSSSGWFGYGFEERLSVTSLQFWEFEPAEGLWLAPDIEAHLYGPLVDSDHSDHAGFRTSGAVFYDDVWEIWARLNAHPPYPEDYSLHGHLRTVSDGWEDRDTEHMPRPTVAWTDGGFLVVWDQWREDSAHSLFSSFIEIVYDY
ncbi:MAG: hypothetical protein JRG91_17935 [Deltaproteobacteria bacterium]|nr:hypothetical protein [Deltaproteobacteria bacterium]